MSLAARWIDRFDAGDRILFDRWVIGHHTRGAIRWSWIVITQAGSAPVVIGAVLLPLAWRDWPSTASRRAALALAASHVAVQLVKRTVSRVRPATPLIRCPDRFSFPSGHAAASLAVAMSYAFAFPALAVPLAALGLLVGWSRVVLGVHYPGDVVAGQILAVAAALGTALVR